jgi:hypothetical protein
MKKSELIRNIYDVDRTIDEIKSEIKAACNDKGINDLDKNRFSKHIEDVVGVWAEVKTLADALIDGEADWETSHELYVKGRLEILKMLKEIDRSAEFIAYVHVQRHYKHLFGIEKKEVKPLQS